MVWEYSFLSFLQAHQTAGMSSLMGFLSFLGYADLLWILLGVLLLLPQRSRKTGAQVLAALLVTFVLGNIFLKPLFERPRPFEVYQALIPLFDRPDSFSFPSGHTMAAFSAATALFCNERAGGTAALLLAALIGFSRMYNLVHYPTDVFAGMIIGIGIGLLVHFLFTRRRKSVNEPKKSRA